MMLSIVIVNYNTRDLLLQTLKSVFENPPSLNYEVYVIDNNSSDDSCKKVQESFSTVKLIKNTENVGFARANNQALRVAVGKYILLLNSDTVVRPKTLDTMLKLMEQNPRFGAAGCKVVLPDGKLDLACKRSFPTPFNSLCKMMGLSKLFPKSKRFSAYNLTYLDENKSYKVDCLVGAFMMVRKDTIDQVGYLDEDYFMYGEDIDWCYRIKKAGWEIYYYGETEIIHYKGASSKKNPKVLYEFYNAMLLFYDKHYQDQYNFLIKGFVRLGIRLAYRIQKLRKGI